MPVSPGVAGLLGRFFPTGNKELPEGSLEGSNNGPVLVKGQSGQGEPWGRKPGGVRWAGTGRMLGDLSKVSALLMLPSPAAGVGRGGPLATAYWTSSEHLTQLSQSYRLPLEFEAEV